MIKVIKLSKGITKAFSFSFYDFRFLLDRRYRDYMLKYYIVILLLIHRGGKNGKKECNLYHSVPAIRKKIRKTFRKCVSKLCFRRRNKKVIRFKRKKNNLRRRVERIMQRFCWTQS